jgi:hypothetical protein
VIVSAGQTSTQTPQSTQASISTTALSSTIFIASLGHSGTQDSQPVHFFLSTLAGIYITLSKNKSKPTSERQMLQNSDDITTQIFCKSSSDTLIHWAKNFWFSLLRLRTGIIRNFGEIGGFLRGILGWEVDFWGKNKGGGVKMQ